MTIKLTDSFVEGLPLASTPAAVKNGYGSGSSYTVGDSEIKGLAIKVGLKIKVWQVAVRPLGGKPLKEKLGNLGESFMGKDPKTGAERVFTLNVANARANARIRIAALRDGRRPAAEKRASVRKADVESKETLAWLIEKHKTEWVKKGADGLPKKNSIKGYNTLSLHLSDWMSKPFRDISREMILERFNKISLEKNNQGKGKKTTANNVFRDLRTAFNNWLAIHPDSGFHNPTDVLAKKWNKSTPRKNWINTRDDGGQFVRWWKAVEAEEHRTVRDYMMVTALQGARETETAQLEWKHLDFGQRIISYLDTKNGEDYFFPMTPKVHEILLARFESITKHEKWVFPANRVRRKGDVLNHISAPPADAVRRIGERAEVKWSMHDLRRTYSNTLMMLGIEERERDFMLKHKINDVSVHYEDLSLMLVKNLGKYENRLLSLVAKTNGKKELGDGRQGTEQATASRIVYRRVSRQA